MIETDQALVRKAQQRDRAAFEELVRRTARLLYSRLFLDTGHAQQAEDLVQETFLVAWRCIGQMTDPSGFRAWLMTLARSALIDATRRAGRKKRFGIRVNLDAADRMTDRGKSPADQVEEEESRQRALATLKALPEEYRLPLTLRYIAGADYETIGRQLGLSNGSLRGLLTRGMTLLREQMQEKVT